MGINYVPPGDIKKYISCVTCFTALQVFRVFRQVSEEQRKMSEGRYRGVLLEAVQDAVYLSAQNQQLQADNKQLRKGQWRLLNLYQTTCYITERMYPNL